MTIETHTRQLRDVFDEASEITNLDERRAFVLQACGANAELLHEVEELLAAHDTAGGFFDGLTPVERPLQQVDEEKIGNYRLIEKLGEGGGGIVWLAEQFEPVRRRVALKILKPGMDTRSVIARFEAERQALALMDHPGIARVFDAGTSPLGRPFFVMELVNGIRITKFCDERRIETAARLELFVRVCQAVQHAHQKGIIHRDLKPSNILVSPSPDEGGAPVPKVIDFGIAKATTDLRLTEKTLVTHAEWLIGTPAYMSPEQAELGAAEIDTRTDIYSLGVLLYELLTGKTPFESDTLLKSGIDAMRRTIRETEPARPSTRLMALGTEDLTDLAQRHRAEPGRLVSLLRGDLDWIVLKALEKDPARRYESASGLAADVQRYLRHEPVEARPPGALYGFQKLVRRNRTAFAVAAGVAALLVAASIVSLRLAFRAWAAEGQQRELRIIAEAAKREAENRAEENRLRLVQAHVARGNQLIGEGDFCGALLPLVDALSLEESVNPPSSPAVEIQRRRVGAALRQAPRLMECWSFPDDSGTAHFSPDGQKLVVLEKGMVRVLDAETGQPTGTAFALDQPAAKVWLPLPDRVLAAAAAGRLRLWDATTGQPTGAIMDTRSASNREAQYDADRWDISPDGRWLLAPVEGGARLFDLATGLPVGPLLAEGMAIYQLGFSPDGASAFLSCGGGGFRQIEVPSGSVLWQGPFDERKPAGAFAISPDGARLVIVSGRHIEALDLWDLREKKPLHGLVTDGYIVDCAFTPDGRRLVVANRARTQVFDAATGKVVGEPVAHRSFVTSVAVSLDGKTFASTTFENVTRIHDTATGQPRSPVFHHPGRVEEIQFGLDGRRFLTRSLGGITRLWDVSGASAVRLSLEHRGQVQAVEFSGDGLRILSCSRDGTACVREAATGRLLARCTHPAPVVAGHFSPDGKMIVTGCSDGGVRIWRAGESESLIASTRHTAAVRQVCFSPDGQLVLSCSDDKTARLWTAATGAPAGPALTHRSAVWCAVFSPDGRRFVTGADREASLWDTATCERIGQPLPHDRIVTAATFTPDGTRLATAQLRSIQLFETATGRRIGQPIPSQDVTSTLRASPDGSRILAASWLGTATLYDVRSGMPAAPGLQHQGHVNAAEFSPDGKMILTFSEDGTAQVWESATGQPVTPPLRHGDNVVCGAWSPDENLVATGSSDGTVCLWDLSPVTEPAAKMRLTAELLSARKLQAGAGAIALTNAEIEERWRKQAKR